MSLADRDCLNSYCENHSKAKMASRAHLRRNTSTPPPGGYGGDGTDDDQSRTSEVTGDQGRAARDESDASVSPRAWELYCTEAWVGDFPRAMYPDGDLGRRAPGVSFFPASSICGGKAAHKRTGRVHGQRSRCLRAPKATELAPFFPPRRRARVSRAAAIAAATGASSSTSRPSSRRSPSSTSG